MQEHLANKIFSEMGSGNSEVIRQHESELGNINLEDFLIYNFKTYSPSYLDLLMLSTFDFWKSFSLKDWKSIIYKTVELKSSLATYYCISFLYKYLSIDSLKLVEQMNFEDRMAEFGLRVFTSKSSNELKNAGGASYYVVDIVNKKVRLEIIEQVKDEN